MSLIADFFFEVGMLARTPRSGFSFLGSGEQSVAEHVYRMLNIAFILARQSEEPVDELHLMHLVLFHDLPEARTGDKAISNDNPPSLNLVWPTGIRNVAASELTPYSDAMI